MYHLLHTKRPKLENPWADVFQVVILFWPSAFHCGFQVLISGIFPFVWKQHKVFSIHFKTSLPVTYRRDRDGNVSLGGMAGWSKTESGGKRDGQSLCWTLIQHAKQKTDLHANSYIWFLRCQNDQRRNENIHRTPETYARSDGCKKHKNFSKQAYSLLEVNLRR